MVGIVLSDWLLVTGYWLLVIGKQAFLIDTPQSAIHNLFLSAANANL